MTRAKKYASPKLYASGNRDTNEPEIINVLKRYNVQYSQGRPGDGYDLLVQLSPMELWEIKNPQQPPAKRNLTMDETEKQAYCVLVGIPYRVIMTAEEAIEAVYQSLKKHHA